MDHAKPTYDSRTPIRNTWNTRSSLDWREQQRRKQEWENCKDAVQEWLVMNAHIYEDHASYDMLHTLWTNRISEMRRKNSHTVLYWREFFAGAGEWLFTEILKRGCDAVDRYNINHAQDFAEEWGMEG